MTDTVISQGEEKRPTVSKVNGPRIYANGFIVSGTGNDIKITLTDVHPSSPDDSGASPGELIVSGVLSVSYHAAKDLANLLLVAVSKFEEKHGKINTPYLKSAGQSTE